MRGHHRKFIDEVNARCLPYYRKIKRGRVVLTRSLVYNLPDGSELEVFPPFVSDLFSNVPDTDYLEIHKSAILHDYMRVQYSRWYADFCFIVDFIGRIITVRRQLIEAKCPIDVVDRETIRLARVACLYLLGVSGKVGSVYIWLDKIF